MSTFTEVTIDRSGLGMGAPITIYGSGNHRYVLAPGPIRPGRTWRRSYATAPYVHGALLTSAVLENSALPISLKVTGSTPGELGDYLDDLMEAVSQFSYTVTLNEDNTITTWAAEPADYTPGSLRSDAVQNLVEGVVLTIPVYPIPGSL